jgi:hypothetical protein
MRLEGRGDLQQDAALIISTGQCGEIRVNPFGQLRLDHDVGEFDGGVEEYRSSC